MLKSNVLSTSFGFALSALKSNKLRTALSLLGVTIGVFSIIAVLAAVDSLDRNIKSELSGFDRNMVYVFNHSFGPTEVPKWKSEQFPKMKYDEYDFLKRNLSDLEYSSYNYFTKAETIKYEANYVEASMEPCSSEGQYLENVKIKHGRFFNESEATNGANVVVIGFEVANTLFQNLDPIGKDVRLYGRKFKVIGVIEKQGASVFNGLGHDEKCFLPVNVVRQMFGENSVAAVPVIVLKPSKGVDMTQFEDEIKNKLRLFRGLKQTDDINFFVNVFGGMLEMIDKIIIQMNAVGWVISGFSLLVGGFGIANIMFVSVKERTHLIGIQKAIGAKKSYILFQFLFEAIILALVGGIIGVTMVWFISIVVTNVTDFDFHLSIINILRGLGLSICIGLISGFLPARSAASLDPVEAIRSGI